MWYCYCCPIFQKSFKRIIGCAPCHDSHTNIACDPRAFGASHAKHAGRTWRHNSDDTEVATSFGATTSFREAMDNFQQANILSPALHQGFTYVANAECVNELQAVVYGLTNISARNMFRLDYSGTFEVYHQEGPSS